MNDKRKLPASFDTVPEEVLSEIDTRLLSGDGGTAIAKWLQEEVGLLPDEKQGSIKKSLERYRARDLRQRLIAQVSSANKHSSLAKVHGKLNALDNLASLIEAQQLRVGKMLKREENLPAGMILGDTKHEMRLLKDMLMELGRLQLETGIIKRAPRSVTGTMTHNGEEVEFSWTEEQEKLYTQLEGSFKVIGDATQTV